MTSIIKAGAAHNILLASLAATTFLESHGHSAAANDIENYISVKLNETVFAAALENESNHYHILFCDNEAVGYSNIIFNSVEKISGVKEPLAKLERLYLLQSHYGKHYGQSLLDFNLVLARQQAQHAVWLYVWKENLRAFQFYVRNGFEIVGSHDFIISARHSNPNYQMLLKL